MTNDIALNHFGFMEMTDSEMIDVEGGSTKVAAAILAIAGGVCFIASGVCSLCGADKASAVCNIAGGSCEVAAGICLLIPAP